MRDLLQCCIYGSFFSPPSPKMPPFRIYFINLNTGITHVRTHTHLLCHLYRLDYTVETNISNQWCLFLDQDLGLTKAPSQSVLPLSVQQRKGI